MGEALSGLDCVHGPAVRKEEHGAYHRNERHHGELASAHAAQIAECPKDHGSDLGVFCKVLHDRGTCGEQRRQGNAEQHDALGSHLAHARQKQNHHRRKHCARKREERRRYGVSGRDALVGGGRARTTCEDDDCKRGAERSALRDTERARRGKRVAQDALVGAPRKRESHPGDNGRQDAGETNVPNCGDGAHIALPEDRAHHIERGNLKRAHSHREHGYTDNRDEEDDEHEALAPDIARIRVTRCFPLAGQARGCNFVLFHKRLF